ncbi:MAG: YybH family protein [Gemmatimonadales bacterium]
MTTTRPMTVRAMVLTGGLLAMLSISGEAQSRADLADQVREAERAFAATMARRDFAVFGTYVADEAVFFGPEGRVMRGKAAVLEGWRGLFDGPTAPFSWEPETVEVLASGTLALTSGPVRNPAGERIGTFNSIWRREADGRWRVVLDKGCPS